MPLADSSGGRHRRPTESLLIVMMRRYRFVLAGLLIGALLGFGVVLVTDPVYESEAELIVQDPRASNLSETLGVEGPSTQASERYVADQVEILRSRLLVEDVRAELGYPSLESVYDRVTITGDLTSNLIEVTFEAGSPERAEAGADAFVDAYEAIVTEQAQETARAALSQADALIAGLDGVIEDLQNQIADSIAEDPTLGASLAELDRLQAELAATRADRDEEPLGSEARANLNARIDELIKDIGALQLLTTVPDISSSTEALIIERDDAVRSRSELISRRNSIAVNAELAGDRLVLVSPASFPEEPAGLPWWLQVAGFAVFGLVVAAAVAYSVELRSQKVMSRGELDSWIDLQPLGEVPKFRVDVSRDELVLLEYPYAVESEAFRLVASSVTISAAKAGQTTLAVASSGVGAGKTTLIANLAIAAGEQGTKVLLVDADFGTHDLTHRLSVAGLGVSAVVFEPDGLAGREATQRVWKGEGSVSLTTLDAPPDRVGGFLRSEAVEDFFDWAGERFDLVLVDGPPPLRVAYASNVVQAAEGVLVVVRHGSDVSSVESLASQLAFLDRPALGYVYTMSPWRSRFDELSGSTAFLDPLQAST